MEQVDWEIPWRCIGYEVLFLMDCYVHCPSALVNLFPLKRDVIDQTGCLGSKLCAPIRSSRGPFITVSCICDTDWTPVTPVPGP